MIYDSIFEYTQHQEQVDCQQKTGHKCSVHSDCQYEAFAQKQGWRKPKVAQPVAQLPPGALSAYEITLTTTKDDPYELRQWIQKIGKSAMFEIIDMPYAIELTEKGLPHIHAIAYSTKKTIDGSKIKKLKFPYRYECKRVKTLQAYQNYILKEKDNPIIIDYCNRKGIEQFSNVIIPT